MRFVILIVVALAMAGGVVFYMQNKGHKNVATIDDSNYTLIAVKDILPGSFIKTGEHFIWQDIPEGKYPKEVSAKFLRKGSFDISELDGAVARRFIAGNEPLDRDFVVTPGEGGFMSAVLYPGMRAISIGVTLVSGNAGFIFPGDKVDLLLTHQVSSVDGDRSYVTETFVQDVRVLAIDQNVNNPDKKAQIAKTVTLEVSPKQAEEVLVAEELGKISLILRSMGNVTFNEVNEIDTKHYTRDNDVSKVIETVRPTIESTKVTITRGRNTLSVPVENSAD